MVLLPQPNLSLTIISNLLIWNCYRSQTSLPAQVLNEMSDLGCILGHSAHLRTHLAFSTEQDYVHGDNFTYLNHMVIQYMYDDVIHQQGIMFCFSAKKASYQSDSESYQKQNSTVQYSTIVDTP